MSDAEELVESEEQEEVVTDLSDPSVVTKYKDAATIANKTVQGLLGYCKPDIKVVTACTLGDTLIKKQCANIYKSKNIEKGIAFPTCISVNELVCHYSPFESEGNDIVLKEGDIVRIDLGVYIDGFISVVAKTFICTADNTTPPPCMENRRADCFTAAYTALEGCTKLLKPGIKNVELTNFIKSVAECYGVNQVQGVLMHQLKRYVIDGNEVILNKDDPENKVEPFEFELNKVYTLDIVLSTGEGKPMQTDVRTTVFKRAIDQNYNLKMKASRTLFSKINQNCGTLPFCVRGLTDDPKVARLGITELIKHGLVHEYPVLMEKGEDVCVVHLKATVTVSTSGTVRITHIEGLDSIKEWCTSSIEPTEEIKAVLSRSAKNKKKKSKKKKEEEPTK